MNQILMIPFLPADFICELLKIHEKWFAQLVKKHQDSDKYRDLDKHCLQIGKIRLSFNADLFSDYEDDDTLIAFSKFNLNPKLDQAIEKSDAYKDKPFSLATTRNDLSFTNTTNKIISNLLENIKFIYARILTTLACILLVASRDERKERIDAIAAFKVISGQLALKDPLQVIKM